MTGLLQIGFVAKHNIVAGEGVVLRLRGQGQGDPMACK